MSKTPTRSIDSPASLVAVAKVAHVTGDRYLEQAAKRLLLEEHGLKIMFPRTRNHKSTDARE